MIFQYNPESTTQIQFLDRSDGFWELVEDHYYLIARTVENFRIEFLFQQSNNEFLIRHLYVLV